MVIAQPSSFSEWMMPNAPRRVADVFVGGVLCTLSAWVIGDCPSWFGLEPGRKFTLPLGLLFRYTYLMAKSIKVHPKKRRGRPATGKDPLVSARLPQTLIDQVEHWACSNEASRSEAIRRLVELWLKAKKS
jgi:hypothetical protein